MIYVKFKKPPADCLILLHFVHTKLKHFQLKTYKDKRFIGAILGQSRKQENSQLDKQPKPGNQTNNYFTERWTDF